MYVLINFRTRKSIQQSIVVMPRSKVFFIKMLVSASKVKPSMFALPGKYQAIIEAGNNKKIPKFWNRVG